LTGDTDFIVANCERGKGVILTNLPGAIEIVPERTEGKMGFANPSKIVLRTITNESFKAAADLAVPNQVLPVLAFYFGNDYTPALEESRSKIMGNIEEKLDSARGHRILKIFKLFSVDMDTVATLEEAVQRVFDKYEGDAEKRARPPISQPIMKVIVGRYFRRDHEAVLMTSPSSKTVANFFLSLLGQVAKQTP